MGEKVQLRDAVVYIDHQGKYHNALVLGIGPEVDNQSDQPAVNLLLIKDSATSEVLDSGSWQMGLEKLTSVLHASHKSNDLGRDCWLFACERDWQAVAPAAKEQEVGVDETPVETAQES